MKLSTDRILTTHVGSLPRSPELSALLLEKDRGEDYDAAAARPRGARGDRRHRQAPGRDRHRHRQRRRDRQGRLFDLYPRAPDRLFRQATPASPRSISRPIPNSAADGADDRHAGLHRCSCTGPVAVKDHERGRRRTSPISSAAVDAAQAGRRVHDRRLAGRRRRRFSPTSSIRRTRPISRRSAPRCSEEYEAIAHAGFVLQLDCPDLAMSRHTGFQDLSEDEFLEAARRSRSRC